MSPLPSPVFSKSSRWCRGCALLSGLALATLRLTATVWYVDGKGDDTREGKGAETAFRNLKAAAAVVNPGDTVLIGNGIYSDPVATMDSSVVVLTRSGRPDAWITWKAREGQHPELRPSGWNGILVTASYQVIEGLTITGSNDSIYLQEAIDDAKKPKASGNFNTNGLYVNGRLNSPETKPHHVIVRHCNVSKCGGGGIIAIQTDYVTIEDCRVSECAWYSRYGCSGISTLTNWAFDDAPGYHFLIQRNYVWNNRTIVPWEKIGKLSDGNGIILDVSDPEEAAGATNPNADKVVGTTPTPTPAPTSAPLPSPAVRPIWRGRTLVANNLSAHNGGSGIHTFRAKHADIINNTTYSNGENVGYPEIFANRSEDVNILNNIMVPRPAGKVTSNNRNTSVRWDYNLYTVASPALSGPHDLVADPHFIDLQPNPTVGNLRLQAGSPALGSGTGDIPLATDILGHARKPGAARDRGAFQQ